MTSEYYLGFPHKVYVYQPVNFVLKFTDKFSTMILHILYICHSIKKAIMPFYKIRAEAYEAANSLVAGWRERNGYAFVNDWVEKIAVEKEE